MNQTERRHTTKLAGCLAALLLVATVHSPVFAQECTEPPDANEQAMNYSLYYESYKNKDYASALPYLKWILKCAPGFAGPGKVDDRNFDRVVKLYEGLAEEAADAETRRAMLDTSLYYFDTAVPTLKDISADFSETEWTLNKGRFIQKHAEHLPELQENVGGIYRQVYDAEPDMLSPRSYYINVIVTDLARKEMKEEAVAFLEDVESRFSDDAETMQIVDTWRNQLFDDPYERMEFLEAQLEKNPQDVDLIGELVTIYKDLEERDKLFGMLERSMELSPSAKIFMEVGVMNLDDGEASAAIGYFERALEQPDAERYARDINYNLGIAAQQLEQYQRARTYYRRALQEDASFGRAIKAIGDLYASAIRECGANMDRNDRAVYWLVVDYMERARQADSSLNATINNAIRTYRPLFPSAEDLFFEGWKPGDTYSVNQGCYSWINETTKVREPS